MGTRKTASRDLFEIEILQSYVPGHARTEESSTLRVSLARRLLTALEKFRLGSCDHKVERIKREKKSGEETVMQALQISLKLKTSDLASLCC